MSNVPILTADQLKKLDKATEMLQEVLIKTQHDKPLGYIRAFQDLFTRVQIVRGYLTKDMDKIKNQKLF